MGQGMGTREGIELESYAHNQLEAVGGVEVTLKPFDITSMLFPNMPCNKEGVPILSILWLPNEEAIQVQVNVHVKAQFLGSQVTETAGTRIDFTHGNHVQITGKIHHTNPDDIAVVFDQIVERNGLGTIKRLVDTITSKAVRNQKEDERIAAERKRHLRMRQLYPNAPRWKRRGCSCCGG